MITALLYRSTASSIRPFRSMAFPSARKSDDFFASFSKRARGHAVWGSCNHIGKFSEDEKEWLKCLCCDQMVKTFPINLVESSQLNPNFVMLGITFWVAFGIAHLSLPWSIGWVALSFLVCLVVRPAMVTPHQISLLLAPDPQTHTFSESLW